METRIERKRAQVQPNIPRPAPRLGRPLQQHRAHGLGVEDGELVLARGVDDVNVVVLSIDPDDLIANY